MFHELYVKGFIFIFNTKIIIQCFVTGLKLDSVTTEKFVDANGRNNGF